MQIQHPNINDYLLTNAGVKFGDFHALMPALYGSATSDPDAYLKILKKDMKDLTLPSQSSRPTIWAELQQLRSEMQAVKDDGGLKKISPTTDYLCL
jgi:hypothetical protein